ncbi:hypothetical protein [Kutzneria kofuensis]|uniref:Secreted protein n=1 Tax=Kutzneria kofuensis TaxID=103725 RepID=A0A7W9KET4_9PSEU|nr:hypothetical protein [Kutzneria kofuensis]MBB5891315.1 hypothetical protein [Kutzneria kofuensis]
MNTKKLTLSLAATAALGVLAVGGAVAFAAVPNTTVQAAGPQTVATGDAKIAKECVAAGQDVPDPAGWRPGARIDVDAQHGFLVIRDDKNAAVCVIENGKGTGIMGGDIDSRHAYGNLTAARPFDYLSSMNYTTESIHFGIATKDVTGVSLVGPDHSVAAGIVKDGTFIVKTKFAEDSNQHTTNHVRATLGNGQVIAGPFRG